MRKPLLRIAAAGFVLFAAPAFAETVGEPASAALLMQAAKKAKDFAQQYRYAYTVDYWTSDGEKELSAKLRFDPRLEEGERWTLLSPSEDDLDKKARKALKQMQKNDGGDEPILYDGLHEMIDDAELVSDTETEAVFLAQVDEEDAPKDALEVYITLDKAAGYVSAIELKSKQPFKPAAVAKVNSLTQIQRFSAPQDGGPALIATSEAQVEGEAMFKSFASETRQVFSEIERVEVAAEETDE
ncbi:hypothetical protein [Hyphococcus sp.]|jgi:hypothetical protein|uniref:hypothetical protein n=1 Tax=Hyphococcus sp. TaxID=2038636 RepID=UPI003D13C0B8